MEEDFERLTRKLQDAVVRQDREQLELLLAPGFHLVTTRSMGLTDRERWIAAATGPFRVHRYDLGNHHILRAGDTAVVIHRLTQDAQLGERIAPRHWLTTDIWTRASSTWQILARHAEALPD